MKNIAAMEMADKTWNPAQRLRLSRRCSALFREEVFIIEDWINWVLAIFKNRMQETNEVPQTLSFNYTFNLSGRNMRE